MRFLILFLVAIFATIAGPANAGPVVVDVFANESPASLAGATSNLQRAVLSDHELGGVKAGGYSPAINPDYLRGGGGPSTSPASKKPGTPAKVTNPQGGANVTNPQGGSNFKSGGGGKKK